MKFRISRLADRDLDRIWKFIARDSATAADRVDAEIHDAMRLLAEHPGAGHFRADIPDHRYRFWAVYSYLVAYRVEEKILIVIRVIHGARDVRKVLGRQVRGK